MCDGLGNETTALGLVILQRAEHIQSTNSCNLVRNIIQQAHAYN